MTGFPQHIDRSNPTPVGLKNIRNQSALMQRAHQSLSTKPIEVSRVWSCLRRPWVEQGVSRHCFSSQTLMHNQPQPSCGRIEDNCAERGRADHHATQEDRLAKPAIGIGCEHGDRSIQTVGFRPAGVFDFNRWGHRPEAEEWQLQPYFGPRRDEAPKRGRRSGLTLRGWHSLQSLLRGRGGK